MTLQIKLKRSQELRLAKHLQIEHPITKGKINLKKLRKKCKKKRKFKSPNFPKIAKEVTNPNLNIRRR